MAEKKQQLAQFSRDAEVRPESFDADANTVEIVWTTGASVRRYSWLDGEEYDEVLSLDAGAVRLDRLNLGAPFLDTHCSYALENVIGSVVPGTAEIKDDRGTATIKLSKAAGVADTVQKIREGVIRNISVGYWIHKVVKTEGTDSKIARWDVVDWEPLEVSAVPIPADPGSQIRSEQSAQDGTGPSVRSCTFIISKSSAVAPKAKEESRMAATRKTAAARGKKKTVAELEAENARLAGLLAAKRDEDKDDKKDDEDERDEDEDKKDDKDSDDERDGDDETKKDDEDDSDEDRDEDDDEERDCDEDDDKRAAPSAKSVRAAAEAAVKAERVRSAEITAIAERAGLPRLGRKHIDKGTSVRGFKNILLERMLDKQGKDTPIRGVSADEDVVRERGTKAPQSEQRQMELGAAHWRKVAGKVEAKA